jgi:hypothetical protein
MYSVSRPEPRTSTATTRGRPLTALCKVTFSVPGAPGDPPSFASHRIRSIPVSLTNDSVWSGARPVQDPRLRQTTRFLEAAGEFARQAPTSNADATIRRKRKSLKSEVSSLKYSRLQTGG